MRLLWECHNQSQDTNWRHCVTRPQLPFFHKRKGVLKIDQPVKMPWRRLHVGVASSGFRRLPLATQPLVAEFNLRWREGSNLWLTTNMKNKIERGSKEETNKFEACDNWFQRFKRRHNISLRRRTKKEELNAANIGRETIQWFHRELRKAVQSQRREERVVDKSCGRWLPKNRLNAHQVPLHFVVEEDMTHKMLGNKQVWIS